MTAPIIETRQSVKHDAEPRFTLRQRLALWLISNAGALAIHLIGCTLRFTVSTEDGVPDPVHGAAKPMVVPFWHRAVFMATYLYRDRGVAVMTSRSFDGEYIARIISQFGFVPVRGSSSRGAVRALLGMHTVIEHGSIAAFTIDGPRGPKYVAKPGPVLLARHTGVPIRCVYLAARDSWTLRSWDEFVVPRPFTNVHVRWSVPIVVPADADAAASQRFHDEMQSTLERVTAYAEEAVRPRS